MKHNNITKLKSQFDSILNVMDDSKVEYWYARDLMVLLGYNKWNNFLKVIDKAITSCNKSGINSKNHFADVGKMVDLGSGSRREIPDVMFRI